MNRLILAMLLLSAAAAHAQTKIQVCPGAAANSAYTACPKIGCALSTSEADIVLTRINGSKIWKPLSTVPPTGDLVQCSVLPPTWTTRAQIGLKPPSTPAPTPPAAPPVGIGEALTWAASSGEVTGYRVYKGTASGVYGPPIDVGMAQSYSLDGLAPGTHYFAVTAKIADGTEGPKSAEVYTSKEPPKQLRCTVTNLEARCVYGP